MMNRLLIVAELRDGNLRKVASETLSAARRCASAGAIVEAVIIGREAQRAQLEAAAAQLSAEGAERVYAVIHEELNHPTAESYLHALKLTVDISKPDSVWFGHTSIGKDTAPAIAEYIGAGQISDVVAIETQDGVHRFIRPVYAGKAFETRVFTSGPSVVTIRPNNITADPPEHSPAVQLELVPYTPLPSPRTKLLDVEQKPAGKIDLSEATVIVSGGRGVKSTEGFKPLEQLAESLNGAVGASRGACDAGYCEYALQIGQTGKVVTPDVYIACGISGAIQHLAGMSASKVIIAINKDPEAPIFQVADYGIVGDLFEVVPKLTKLVASNPRS
jgi:electron transfer flavoprotein alpha subunit